MPAWVPTAAARLGAQRAKHQLPPVRSNLAPQRPHIHSCSPATPLRVRPATRQLSGCCCCCAHIPDSQHSQVYHSLHSAYFRHTPSTHTCSERQLHYTLKRCTDTALQAREYLAAGDAADAARLLASVTALYRRERWTAPLAASLLECREAASRLGRSRVCTHPSLNRHPSCCAASACVVAVSTSYQVSTPQLLRPTWH